MRELNADVVVVGAGPAGIAAAVEAAETGAQVCVVDDNPQAGGQIWRQGAAPPPARAVEWLERFAASGADRLAGTTVVDADTDGRLFLRLPEGTARLAAGATILATGSRERLLPFPGWTLPGVMGAGGLQALAKTGWPIVGRRVVVAGSGPLLMAVAQYLAGAGANVVALVEQASRGALAGATPRLLRYPDKLRQAIAFARDLRRVPRFYGSWIRRVEGTDAVAAVTLHTPSGERRVECDLVACGFGLLPETRLARLLGAATGPDGVQVGELQRTSVPALYAAGEITGVGGVDVAVAEGRVAGRAAAGDEVGARSLTAGRDRERGFANALESAFALREELASLPDADTIVCRCEDVTFGELAVFDDARDAKLKTRCGMGPCQGRVCGPAMRFIGGWAEDRIRPPLFPIETAALTEISAAQTNEAVS